MSDEHERRARRIDITTPIEEKGILCDICQTPIVGEAYAVTYGDNAELIFYHHIECWEGWEEEDEVCWGPVRRIPRGLAS